jgi:DegV family protein with EDD domain
MNRIAVVTDSTCCIPDDLVQKYGINVIPLIIIWDRTRYRDGVDVKPLDFFKKLRTVTTTFPSTSSAVQGAFQELFEELRGQVNGVAAIVLGKRIPTAAFDSALNAARMVPELKIEIVDTDITGIGMGFAVLAAAKLAASGGNLEEVAEIARSTARKTHTFWMQESLDYIRRGGRVQIPQLNEAEWQNVKPLMTLRDGKIIPFEKQPTKETAMERLLQLMSDNIKVNSPLHAAVMHADDAQGAEELRSLISKRFECSELLMTEFTPIMGAHFGPGALGLAFYNE